MREIHCPNCGGRSRDEFRFGGELPTVPDSVTEPAARNVDYVWFFDNLDGPSTERWFHEAGCRRWFTVQRDTHRDVVLGSPGDDHG
jgi:sarcosine oxidase, subunit delta